MNPPREIGSFEIAERLGAGGMGEVFRARDKRLNRYVAVKFLPEAASPSARERFQREAPNSDAVLATGLVPRAH